jgi:hypothetical protein
MGAPQRLCTALLPSPSLVCRVKAFGEVASIAATIAGTAPTATWTSSPAGSPAEGWTLRELPLAATCEGFTNHIRRIIATDTRLEPAARLVVLLHEAAHVVLHGDLNSSEYQQHRGVCETEAESTPTPLCGQGLMREAVFTEVGEGTFDVLDIGKRRPAADVLAIEGGEVLNHVGRDGAHRVAV